MPNAAGEFVAVLGIGGWTDDSGGKKHELGFANDAFYIRSGTIANGWEPWKKIFTHNDLGPWRINGRDLIVNNKRAMVGFDEGTLHLNYGKDFKDGVNVHGKLNASESLQVAGKEVAIKDDNNTFIVRENCSYK
ncbi:hypothetical protein ACT7DN_30375 [Bacillus paranthracis]